MTRRIFCKVLLVVVAIFGLLVLSSILSAQGNRDWAFDHVQDVQDRNTNWLMAMDGVEGTAIGYNQNERLAVKVFTAGPDVPGIPRTLDGVPVQVVVTGKFYALPKPPSPPGQDKKKEEKIDPTARFERPVPIGVSTGNIGECSSGTIGCRVTDGTDFYALSNNHVYALENTAPTGSAVLQPGRYDADPQCAIYPADSIGTLADFETIVFSEMANNTIDAAIALIYLDPDNEPLVGNSTPSDGYETPSSTTTAAYVGLEVQKYGRTSSLTKGTVTGINAIVKVGYSSGTARFIDQITVEARRPFIKAGDSGSLLVTDPDKEPVGLLFAGSGSGKFAIANPIDAVLTTLGDNIGATLTIDGN